MINELKGSAVISFFDSGREGHEFSRAINPAKSKRLSAAEVSFFWMLILPQGLKPAAWLGLCGTAKAVPFPFLHLLDSTIATESRTFSTPATPSHA